MACCLFVLRILFLQCVIRNECSAQHTHQHSYTQTQMIFTRVVQDVSVSHERLCTVILRISLRYIFKIPVYILTAHSCAALLWIVCTLSWNIDDLKKGGLKLRNEASGRGVFQKDVTATLPARCTAKPLQKTPSCHTQRL